MTFIVPFIRKEKKRKKEERRAMCFILIQRMAGRDKETLRMSRNSHTHTHSTRSAIEIGIGIISFTKSNDVSNQSISRIL